MGAAGGGGRQVYTWVTDGGGRAVAIGSTEGAVGAWSTARGSLLGDVGAGVAA
jgi:hypothetical protein